MPPLTTTITIKSDPATRDLWHRLFVAASLERSTTTARDLFRRAMLRERRAMRNRRGAAWLAKAETIAPRPAPTTTAPPPAAETFVD